jgi:hypothetical protein
MKTTRRYARPFHTLLMTLRGVTASSGAMDSAASTRLRVVIAIRSAKRSKHVVNLYIQGP